MRVTTTKKELKKLLLEEHYLPEYEDMYNKVVEYISKYGFKDFLKDIYNHLNKVSHGHENDYIFDATLEIMGFFKDNK